MKLFVRPQLVISKFALFIALAFVLTGISSVVYGASVSRGPYLQLGAPTSVVVRWRTDSATDSRVRFGTTQGSLTLSASDAASTTEHVVSLTGLSPDTKYFYTVGTTSA